MASFSAHTFAALAIIGNLFELAGGDPRLELARTSG
jgi:hypothetical protein